MKERQKILFKKLHIQSLKNTLRQLSGIEVLEIFENDENTALNDMYLAYTPLMCQPATPPYSKLSYKSTEEQVISWLIINMELTENTVYFFYCCGTWVKIRISNLLIGVKSLWEYKHSGEKGFLLSDVELTQIMEASFDSRDEENYLIDIWNYKSSKCYESSEDFPI